MFHTLGTPLLIVSVISFCISTEVKEVYKWNYINYTWPNQITYQYHLQTGLYIPENNLPTTIKILNNRIYIALGRYFPGIPVTMGFINIKDKRIAPLVTPFPDWDTNIKSSCQTLQNVIAFDFDKNGIIWILDGFRKNNLTTCPPKLVMYNVVSHKKHHSYEFPSEGDINGAYLGDIVVDNNYAYITDSNSLDPGIIIYSRNANKSWKLRDSSMFPNEKGVTFTFGKSQYNYYHSVGPIAVSPNNKKTRFIFYSPISSLNIYKINVAIIQKVSTIEENSWRSNVQLAGTKVSQSWNYAMNNNSDLYFCVLNKNSLAKWNIDKDFRTATYVSQNNMINWCTGSTIKDDNLYLLSGNLGEYLIRGTKPSLEKNVFRLLRVVIKDIKKKH